MKSVLMALFGLSLAISISGVEIFGSLLLVLCLWPYLAKVFSSLRSEFPSSKRQLSPLDVPILIFVSWIFICALVTKSIEPSGAFAKQTAVLYFFLMVHGMEQAQIKKVAFWFCVGSAVVGLWGILQHFSGFDRSDNLDLSSVPPFLKSWPTWLIYKFGAHSGRAVGSRSH